MGQQQLLLLVLGIVIVGLAVVVGIQAFSENQKKANADALVMTSMRIASDAQAWLRKPAAFGGAVPGTGVRPVNFSGLTLFLETLGYPVTGSGASQTYSDVNGTYTAVVSGANFIISGTSSGGTTTAAGDNNLVCVYVQGAQATNIATSINPAGATTCPTTPPGATLP